MKTLILLILFLTAMLASGQGRKFRFSWDPNPEDIVAGYTIEFREPLPDGTFTEWRKVADHAGKDPAEGQTTVQEVVEGCPDGPFEARLFAYATNKSEAATTGWVEGDEIFVTNWSLPSETVKASGQLSKPGTPRATLIIETSANLKDWEPIAETDVALDKEKAFFRAIVVPSDP